MSKDERIRKAFHAKFGERYRVVRDYYLDRASTVTVADVSEWVPELLAHGLEETS